MHNKLLQLHKSYYQSFTKLQLHYCINLCQMKLQSSLLLAALAFLVVADRSFFATILFFAAAAACPSLEHVVSGARPDGALLSRMN
jgi:hypothetical protein